jgi:hypothetical protein
MWGEGVFQLGKMVFPLDVRDFQLGKAKRHLGDDKHI